MTLFPVLLHSAASYRVFSKLRKNTLGVVVVIVVVGVVVIVVVGVVVIVVVVIVV